MTDIPDLPQTEAAIIALTNSFRRSERLGEVTPSKVLTAAAHAFAAYLAKSGSFAHEADGRTPAARATAAGYRYCAIAENLALDMDSRGFSTGRLAAEAMAGWRNSPPHRKNLLAPDVTEIGVGIAKAADKEKYLSVQLLGRPQSLSYSFKIENRTGWTISYTAGLQTVELKPRFIMTHSPCGPVAVTFQKASQGIFKSQPLDMTRRVAGKAHYVIEAVGDTITVGEGP